jgi:hypothetical protein
MKLSESFLAHREALREITARHGVTRPRVFGGAAQRSRSRMRTRGRDARA